MCVLFFYLRNDNPLFTILYRASFLVLIDVNIYECLYKSRIGLYNKAVTIYLPEFLEVLL